MSLLTDDQFRFFVSLTLSIPFSYVLRIIPDKIIKKLYSVLLGTALQFYVYGGGMIFVFLLHLFVYSIIMMIPHRCGSLVTISTLLILSGYHIHRLAVDYGGWKLDLSTVLMTCVCKYSMFAYAVQDGVTDGRQLKTHQIQHRLIQRPSIFKFISFMQFLPTAVIGTSMEYKIYEDYMQNKGNYQYIPQNWSHIYKTPLLGLLLGIMYFIGEKIAPVSFMHTPEFINQYSALQLIVYAYISVSFVRFKYYMGWLYSMGAVHASGISYRKLSNGKQDFKQIQVCNPYSVETSRQIRVKIANWNMTAQEWLKKCIYERLPFKSKANCQLGTFMISAFWHGYYGGYYISFFLWFAQTHLQRLIYKQSQREKSFYIEYFNETGIYGRILLWIGSNILFTVDASFFLVLSLRQSLDILGKIYYLPFIIIFSLILLMIFFPGGKNKERSKRKRISHEE